MPGRQIGDVEAAVQAGARQKTKSVREEVLRTWMPPQADMEGHGLSGGQCSMLWRLALSEPAETTVTEQRQSRRLDQMSSPPWKRPGGWGYQERKRGGARRKWVVTGTMSVAQEDKNTSERGRSAAAKVNHRGNRGSRSTS